MRTGTTIYLRLKPECIEEYKDFHDNIWPELEALYRGAGITTISCAMNGPYLIVYEEYNQGVYENARMELDNNETEIRWKELMRSLRDRSFEPIEFEEVYRLE